jgi:hypothetical protein
MVAIKDAMEVAVDLIDESFGHCDREQDTVTCC